MKRRKAFVVDEQVWKVLVNSTQPVGAYQIANMLPKVSATQVYRVLERLVSSGKARRIAAGNAFVVASSKTDAIVICRKCGEFELLECPEAIEGLERHCDGRSFQAKQIFLEMIGTCRDCRG
ncbi:Fur family transcriptional regulator [Parasphingorhabdus cellanae]|uniref:Fur family transcriptional regulator n=1 Tax=Parasphingorhabdus cellanae TaxID=2806553 RepID=UPI001FB19D02|nr:transcriptional repressor [Parasphingorhabdus cellanae]